MTDLERELSALAASLGPTVDQRSRILGRLARPDPPRASRIPVALALAAAAAAVSVGVWTHRPGERALGGGRWESLTDEIAVLPNGQGTWDGRDVRWDDGTVRVSVTPDRGVRLRILTPEAVVEVVGTVFSVARDAHGTRVAVERGTVSTSCLGEAAVLSGAGGRHSCFRSADAGLGLALELEALGKGAEIWLPEVERARAHPVGSEEARSALRAMAVDGLLAEGEIDRAADEARAWLVRPDGNAPAPVAAVARALLDRTPGAAGCTEARPFLASLADGGDGVAGIWLADCTTDPTVRRTVLEAAARDPRPEVQAAVDARNQPGGR